MAPTELTSRTPSGRPPLVKPGMTGLWPAGREHLSEAELAAVDVRYAEAWSPVLDARILVRTVRSALRSRVPS